MKRLLATCFAGLAILGYAESVLLTWEASPSPGVGGYRIYYGTSPQIYGFVTNAGPVLTQLVALPHPGRWFFAATAVDTNGLESCFSNEAQWESKPAPPVMQGESWVRLTPVIACSTNLVDWEGVACVPTWLPATNTQEFFTNRQLTIERVQRASEL